MLPSTFGCVTRPPKVLALVLVLVFLVWTYFSASFLCSSGFWAFSSRLSAGSSDKHVLSAGLCRSTLLDTVENISRSHVEQAQGSSYPYLFPPIIHQIWLGNRPFPSSFSRSQESFRTKNPDMYYALWRDNDIACLIRRFYPVLAPVYAKITRVATTSDLARYLVLYVFGGFYSDTDTVCLQPIRKWPMLEGTQAMVGLEAEFSHVPNWQDMIVVRQIQVSVWTLASTPLHPLFGSAIHGIFVNCTRLSREKLEGMDVMEVAGPGYFTDTVFHYMHAFGAGYANLSGMSRPTLFGDLLVQPLHVFRWEGRGPEEEACIQHLFGQSWRWR